MPNVFLTGLVLCELLFSHHTGLSQNLSDSTQYSIGLCQLTELIENAEQVLNKTEKQLLKKPTVLKSTAKWEVRQFESRTEEYKTIYVVDIGSGALLITFPVNKRGPRYMLFSPKLVTVDEGMAYLKEKYKLTSTKDVFFIRRKGSKRRVAFGAKDFQDLNIKGILIMATR